MLGLLPSPSETLGQRQARWPGVVLSITLHLAILLTIPFWNALFLEVDQALARSVEDAIELNEKNKRLVWYRLPTVPSIRNSAAETDREKARGEKYSKNEVVADQADAQSAKQLIHRADATAQAEEDLALQNMVAKAPAPESAAAAAPRKRASLPPAAERQVAQAEWTEAPLELSPTSPSNPLSASSSILQAQLARLPKPPPRKFAAPETVRQDLPNARLDFANAPELTAQANLPSNAGSMQIAKLAKPAARKFAPPASMESRQAKTATRLEIDAPPQVTAGGKTNLAGTAGEIASLPKMPPRKFSGPPGGSSPGAKERVGNQQAIEFGSVPATNAGTGEVASLSGTGGTGKIPRLARRKAELPGGSGTGSGKSLGSGTANLEAPPELTAKGGTGTGGKALSEVAVVSLNPGKALAPPPGKLGGKFSQAQEIGPPAHVGNKDPNAVPVPGVSTRPAGNANPDVRLRAPEQILGQEVADGFFEVKLDLARQWPRLSVPLAPSSRRLPPRILPYFRERSVFTVVIPMERMDRYTGDWIVWFSPKSLAGTAPTVYAQNVKMETPLPLWKLESRQWLVTKGEAGLEQRVQLIVEIGSDGKVQIKELLGRFGNAFNQMVTNDLSRWVFQPARKDGQAIAVDAVIEIPFRIPNTLVSEN